MSRIGNNPVVIPQGVTVDINDNIVTVKGKLGELSQDVITSYSIHYTKLYEVNITV